MKLKLAITVAMATSFFIPICTNAAVDGPSINWRIATTGKPRTGTTHIETIKKYVEKETGGKFTITLGYGTFGNAREFLDLLKIGSVQGATIQASLSVDRMPLYTVLDLPFLPLGNPDTQRAVHEATHKHPAIMAEFAAWGAIPFMSSLLPSYELLGTSEPPKTLADIKGLQFRALGGAGNALAKLGAHPVSMPASEVFLALDRKRLNGVAFPYYAHVSYRSYELGKWMSTNLALGTTAFPVAFNKKAWEALPAQYKNVMLSAREVAYEAQKNAFDQNTSKSLDKIKGAGVKLIQFPEKELTAFRAAGGQPVWDEWVRERTSKGQQGQEILGFVLSEIKKAQSK